MRESVDALWGEAASYAEWTEAASHLVVAVRQALSDHHRHLAVVKQTHASLMDALDAGKDGAGELDTLERRCKQARAAEATLLLSIESLRRELFERG